MKKLVLVSLLAASLSVPLMAQSASTSQASVEGSLGGTTRGPMGSTVIIGGKAVDVSQNIKNGTFTVAISNVYTGSSVAIDGKQIDVSQNLKNGTVAVTITNQTKITDVSALGRNLSCIASGPGSSTSLGQTYTSIACKN